MFKLIVDEDASINNFNTHILKFSFVSIKICDWPSNNNFKSRIYLLINEYKTTCEILEKVGYATNKSTYHEYLARIEGMGVMFIWLFEQVNYRKALLEKVLLCCEDSSYVRPQNLSERDIKILEDKNYIETKSFTLTHTNTSIEFYKNTHRPFMLKLFNFYSKAIHLLHPYRKEIADMYYFSLFLPKFNQDLLNYFIKHCLFNDLTLDITRILKKHNTFLLNLE